MSDRLAVMSAGVIEQVGAPEDVYEQPTSAFVANFIGVSNVFRGRVQAASAGVVTVKTDSGRSVSAAATVVLEAGQRAGVVVRPERVKVFRADHEEAVRREFDNVLPGSLSSVVYVGASTQFVIETPDGDRIQAIMQNTEDGQVAQWDEGLHVVAAFNSGGCSLIEGREEEGKDLMGEVVRPTTD